MQTPTKMKSVENGKGVFVTTHWSVVLTAGNPASPDAHAALCRLCETYWHPIYCCIRSKGYSPENAEDLTQGFFANLLDGDLFSRADRTKGLFRAYLLRSMEYFIRNEHHYNKAKKRGGGFTFTSLDFQTAEEAYAVELKDQLSPEQLYERRWAAALLNRVVHRLRQEFCDRGSAELFDLFEPRLWRDDSAESHAELGVRLGMTEAAVKQAVRRLRQRYAELLREEIAQTVDSPDQIASELEYLQRVFSN